jgi:hypothetical protein
LLKLFTALAIKIDIGINPHNIAVFLKVGKLNKPIPNTKRPMKNNNENLGITLCWNCDILDKKPKHSTAIKIQENTTIACIAENETCDHIGS